MIRNSVAKIKGNELNGRVSVLMNLVWYLFSFILLSFLYFFSVFTFWMRKFTIIFTMQTLQLFLLISLSTRLILELGTILSRKVWWSGWYAIYMTRTKKKDRKKMEWIHLCANIKATKWNREREKTGEKRQKNTHTQRVTIKFCVLNGLNVVKLGNG